MNYNTLEELAKICGVVSGLGIVLTVLALCVEAFTLAGAIFGILSLFDMLLFGLSALFIEEEEN